MEKGIEVTHEVKTKRYEVVSRGRRKPEHLPAIGETVVLFVRDKQASAKEKDLKNLEITAEYTEKLGDHTFVIGKVKVVNEELRFDARYEIDKEYSRTQTIGELTIKKIS